MNELTQGQVLQMALHRHLPRVDWTLLYQRVNLLASLLELDVQRRRLIQTFVYPLLVGSTDASLLAFHRLLSVRILGFQGPDGEEELVASGLCVLLSSIPGLGHVSPFQSHAFISLLSRRCVSSACAPAPRFVVVST